MTTDKVPWHESPKFLSLLHTFMKDEKAQERRLFKAPDLPFPVPGGTCLAQDSAASMYSYLNGQPGWCGLGFPGYSYLSELTQRSEYQAPVLTIASELTRRWITFEGGDEKKRKELSDEVARLCVRNVIYQAVIHDGYFGRGQVYVKIKGQNAGSKRQLPLTVDDDNEGKTIQKGQLEGFVNVEPIWSTPMTYNSSDPTEPDFYQPSVWYVMSKPTHASRLLPFISRPLPDILKPAYNFSGMALSQLMEPYATRWLKTVDSVNRLISNFATLGIATNLQASLEDGNNGSALFTRMELFNKFRDNRGILLLDKATEEFFQNVISLANLDKLQAQAQEHMAAVTHIPLVKLTGITPSGLNASSEEDLIVWYDWCASLQINLIDPQLTKMIKLIQLSLWGAVDSDIKYCWVPLDSPTDKEESEIRKADGDRDTAYVGGGVLSADEVRERLRNDPRSGYSFIQGEAPATPLEEEHALGEESKDADATRAAETGAVEHERAAETAEADHKRALELERVKAAAKPKPKKN